MDILYTRETYYYQMFTKFSNARLNNDIAINTSVINITLD